MQENEETEVASGPSLSNSDDEGPEDTVDSDEVLI